MKRRSSIHSPSVILLALLVFTTVAQASGTPKIQFDQKLYDFGTTSLVEQVSGTFTFHNAGDGVLTVQKPKPVCGCTVASVSPENLNPGATGELVFTLTLGTSPHLAAKQIFLPTNDPQNPSVQLDIRAELKKIFDLQPSYLHIEELRLGTTNTSSIAMKRVDGKPLTILKLEPSSPWITAKLEPAPDSSNDTARLQVVMKPVGSPHPLNERLLIYTPDKSEAAVTISISGTLVGDVKVEPAALVWNLTSTAVRSRTLLVSATQSDFPLKIRNVICSAPEVRVEAMEVKSAPPGQQVQLNVTVSPELRQTVSGTISFETAVPTMPKLVVPFQINVPKP